LLRIQPHTVTTYLALHVVCGLVAFGLTDSASLRVFVTDLLLGPVALGDALRGKL